jgi:hypothetical protein
MAPSASGASMMAGEGRGGTMAIAGSVGSAGIVGRSFGRFARGKVYAC